MAIHTLALGFGGSGTHILTALKELSVYKFGDKPAYLEFLEFDTIADWKPGATIHTAGAVAEQEEKIGRGHEISLDPHTEYFYLGDTEPNLRTLVEGVLRDPEERRKNPHLDPWLHSDWLSQIMPGAALDITKGAAQQRQIGRYAMFANAEKISNLIGSKMREMKASAGSDSISVWLFASAAGGTGAGCMLDAAYLVRHAAREQGVAAVLTGVIILPGVYSDRGGIDKARAYSLFRELERLQEVGLAGGDDRYRYNGESVSSHVRYTRDGRINAFAPQRLFDYLIYLNQSCKNEADRIRFFGSVGNAIDPFFDAHVGASQMEALVNHPGTPMAFGASRLTLPKNTYAERFAWELVADYLTALGAPMINAQQQVVDVAKGAEEEREEHSGKLISELLPIFKELGQLSTKREEESRQWLNQYGAPQNFIQQLYQFAANNILDDGIARKDLENVVPLTYCNPYRVYELGPNDSLDGVTDFNIFSYKEARQHQGLKEDQKESAERYHEELSQLTKRYFNAEGGQQSFAFGFKLVQDVMRKRLLQRVDQKLNALLTEMQPLGRRGLRAGEPSQLSELYWNLRYCERWLGEDGRLTATVKRLLEFIDGDAATAGYEQAMVNALAELKDAKKPMFSLGAWVEELQSSACDKAWEFVRWQQQRRLFEGLLSLLRDVNERLSQWRAAMDHVLTQLVRDKDAVQPALARCRKRLRDLESRLARMADDGSLIISLGSDPKDTTMDGFETVLRERAVFDAGEHLVDGGLAASHWLIEQDASGKPQLGLQLGDRKTGARAIGQFYQVLFDRFSTRIKHKLEDYDIFDYLDYVDTQAGLDLGSSNLRHYVAEKLKSRAKVLLNLNTAGRCQWVHSPANGAEKRKTAEALQLALNGVKGGDMVLDPISNHTDRNSITLLMTNEPPSGSPADIPDLNDCLRDYLRVQAITSDAHTEVRTLRYALVHHPFRPEQEAWFIERENALHAGQSWAEADLMPPRARRLLESPAMLRALVHCLATGAVYVDEERRQWAFRAVGRDAPILLDEEGKTDLFRMMVVFVLQRRASARAVSEITEVDALESARNAAREQGQSYADLVAAFGRGETIEHLLKKHLTKPSDNAGIRAQTEYQALFRALAQILRFYSDYSRSARLSERQV